MMDNVNHYSNGCILNVQEELYHLLIHEIKAFDLGHYEMSKSAIYRLELLIQRAYELGYQQGFDNGQHSILLSQAYR